VIVKVFAAGALTHSLPSGKTTVEAETLTVEGLLGELISRDGPDMDRELLKEGTLKEGLALLVNGRNVLSLPEQFETPLRDGDEVLITIIVAGG
jgi:molybdopterin converting factor small subunit